jgi:hypothetical protein
MENKKYPLMSAKDWIVRYSKPEMTMLECCEAYANYVTQWHLNNAKEFVADGIGFIPEYVNKIDKQSIHTAIDNYIKDNL